MFVATADDFNAGRMAAESAARGKGEGVDKFVQLQRITKSFAIGCIQRRNDFLPNIVSRQRNR
jgi:hypothetical protein